MKHRHLVDDAGFDTAAIDDILEHGKPDDWKLLWAEVVRDPWGEVTETVLHLCQSHEMYGTSRLWPQMIRDLRAERNAEV